MYQAGSRHHGSALAVFRPQPPASRARRSRKRTGEGVSEYMHATIRFTGVIPILRMFDVAKAREFYLDYLGFKVDFEHRFHEEAPLFMGLSRDGVRIFLSEHHGDGSPGVHVRVETSGVRDFHRELSSKMYRYMNPRIIEREWGARELSVVDPFGNTLIFSEPIEVSESELSPSV